MAKEIIFAYSLLRKYKWLAAVPVTGEADKEPGEALH